MMALPDSTPYRWFPSEKVVTPKQYGEYLKKKRKTKKRGNKS